MTPPLAPCSHRPTCPGCPRYAETGIAPHARAALEGIAKPAGATLEPVREAGVEGYRHRARLMVRGRTRSPKIGLFQQDSHRIADIPTCIVHHPLVNVAARELKAAMREHAIAPYADRPHRGSVRALQAVIERSTQTLQLVIVANDTSAEPLHPLLDTLATRVGSQLHSLWWNGNPARTNTILGPHWHAIAGPNATREVIGGSAVFFPPGAFGQSHLELADQIVAALHQFVPTSARVIEYYAGCGAIGLGLLERGQAVSFNEASPASLAGLRQGLAAQPGNERARVLEGTAGSFASEAAHHDVAIVDPPRKGLDAALRSQLSIAPPERVLYLSCDVTSLAADTHELLAPGRLRLRQLSPFASFPFTEHVETLAVFERAAPHAN